MPTVQETPSSIPGSGGSPGEGIGYHSSILGLPCGSSGKQSSCNAGDLRLDIWVGKIPWGRDRLPTTVFGPGEFLGLQRVRHD